MNQKLSRLLRPSMRLYFLILVIFAIVTVFVSPIVAAAEGGVIVLLFIYSQIKMSRQRSELVDYIEEVTYSVESVHRDNMFNFPMPMVIFRLDNSEIIWSNDGFLRMTGDREHLFEQRLGDVVPEFTTKWLLEGKTLCPEVMAVGERKYQVFGNIVRSEPKNQKQQYLGNAYWIDVTDFSNIKDEFYASRPICTLIDIDNYDELIKNVTEKEKSTLLSDLDERISLWTEGTGGLLCKLDRDRYLFLHEERYLDAFEADKFSILDRVREVSSPTGISATVSIGIGRDSSSIHESYEFARLGIEMALSRGGDQAVTKNQYSFTFYGGRTNELESRTKVKSRVMANSLKAFISGSEDIYVMGHKQADLDSLGAAVGVCCIARALGVQARIIIDIDTQGTGPMMETLLAQPEYQGRFIAPQDAMLEMKSKSLLIVVDTNRPNQVESEEILASCNNVAVIDHHRRAADYIQNPVINFHEPYASSACELVAELLQYTVNQSDILRVEAEAVMAGIVMDTKNFTMRTGSRTFEAAAFLRQAGASTTEVKRMMQNDFAGTVERYNIVRQAKLYKTGIAIASSDVKADRIVAAQAADELVNISGIQASFVLFSTDGAVGISARSIGDLDVQIILERLGGGGNRSTAGAQIRGQTQYQVLANLTAAINQELAEQGYEKE